MRRVQSLSFPHPVLGNRDDVAGSFEPSLTRHGDRKDITLEIRSLETGNASLDSYILRNQARYAIQVECASSGYRESFLSTGPSFDVKIPLERLYRTVEVDVGIVAIDDIIDYRPSGLHPDYEDAQFEIEAGDVLAVGDGWRFSITTEWDPMRAPISSLMRIVRGADENGPMVVDFETERILVKVPEQDFKRYLRRKGDSAALLHAAIVLPVLSAAIERRSREASNGTLWATRLGELLETRQIDDDDALRAAQELLRMPVSRGLECLERMREGSNDDA